MPEGEKGSHGRDCRSCLWFLEEDDLYKTIKPYRLLFTPEDDFPRTNVKRKEVKDIIFNDIRGFAESPTLQKNGFQVFHMANELTTQTSDDEVIGNQFLGSLQRLLQEHFRTPNVLILDKKIRKKDATFPRATGKVYAHNQPVLMAHIDWTSDEIARKVRRELPEKADEILSSHLQFVHAWKPLMEPVRDWPLALCDASSLDPLGDLERLDRVYDPDQEPEENFQVYHRAHHRWCYLSDQTASEVYVFRQYDSELGYGSGIPHAAFPDPCAVGGEEPRASIEVQILIYWDSMGE